MTAPARHKRSQVLSNPRVQLRIIGLFALLALLYAGTNFYVAGSSLGKLGRDALALQVPEDVRHDLNVIVRQHEEVLNVQLMLFTFLSFCVLTLCGVLLSHRVGGPVYQLTRYLEGMAAGTVKPRQVRFRKGDFFHELAARFNDFQKARGILGPDDAPPGPSAGGPKS
jgi:hypothetical protein